MCRRIGEYSFLELFCQPHKQLFIHCIDKNNCWAPHVETSPKRLTVAAIELSSLRPHFSRMRLSVSDCGCHTARFQYPPKQFQRCFIATWLQLATWSCGCLGLRSVYTMHQFTESLYSMPHTWDACVFICDRYVLGLAPGLRFLRSQVLLRLLQTSFGWDYSPRFLVCIRTLKIL